MTYRDILKKVDHTLLKQPSTWEQIREICDDAVKYGTASVCIPPSYVKQAAEYLDAGINRMSIGLQSAHNDELAMLGRIHTYGSTFLNFFFTGIPLFL